MEKKSLEELRQAFAKKITPYKEGVFLEFQKREKGYGEPEIVSGLSKSDEETAKRLVELQKEKGFFARKDMVPEDFYKLQAIAKKYGLTIKEAVSKLITNDKYLSPSEVEVQNICNLMTDIFEVYEKHYKTLGKFPVNALSQASRDYLSNKKIPLGLAEKLRVVFEEYLPEHSGLTIVDKSYVAVPRYRHEWNEEIEKQMLEDLAAKCADKNGNIDKVFSPANAEHLKNILEVLKERKIAFEDFSAKGGLTYTKCLSLDAVPAVLQMIGYYKQQHGTYQGITRNDPYLRSKIDFVEDKERTFKLGEFLDKYDVDNDVLDNHQAKQSYEIFSRLVKMEERLIELFPDGVIPSNFSTEYAKEYSDALTLSQRMGYESITEFLGAHGFSRNKGGQGRTYPKKIVLSERDLAHYGFFDMKLAEDENLVDKFGIEVLPVEGNLAIYRDLIARCQDSVKVSGIQQKGE